MVQSRWCAELLGAGLGGREEKEARWVSRGQTKEGSYISCTLFQILPVARVDGELLYLEQKSSMIGSEFIKKLILLGSAKQDGIEAV